MIGRLADEIRPAHDMGYILDHIVMGHRDMVARANIFAGHNNIIKAGEIDDFILARIRIAKRGIYTILASLD